MRQEKIGEGLVRIGALNEDQKNQVLKRQMDGDNRLFGEIAIELDFIDDGRLMDYIDSVIPSE